MMKRALLVSMLVLMLALPTAPASAVDYFLDPTYCASPLNGIWSTSPP